VATWCYPEDFKTWSSVDHQMRLFVEQGKEKKTQPILKKKNTLYSSD